MVAIAIFYGKLSNLEHKLGHSSIPFQCSIPLILHSRWALLLTSSLELILFQNGLEYNLTKFSWGEHMHTYYKYYPFVKNHFYKNYS